MNASKENAAEAAACLERIRNAADDGYQARRADVDFLRAFLEAARRKLPSEAAFACAKEGRKK